MFLSSGKGVELLNLNDKGYLAINGKNLDLQLVDQENNYDLTVKNNDSIIFSKSDIQGISKILSYKDWLLFTYYTFFSEDGANEGKPVLINTELGTVNMFERPLENTCNPVVDVGFPKLRLCNFTKFSSN